ncbi:retrovirus-related pol polyprotein from transposon TNT 1-94 [Tanacetum coccineum]
MRLLLVEADSDGGVIGLAISLPLNLVDALYLVEDGCFDVGAHGDIFKIVSTAVRSGTAGELSIASTTGIVTVVGVSCLVCYKDLNEKQKKRRAQVQFEAQHYTYEDWDLIRVKIEADAELSKSVLGSDLQGEDFAKKMVDLNQGTWKLSQLKNLSFVEVKEEFDKLVKQSTKKTGKRRKQIARKGLYSDKTDENEYEDSKDDDPILGTNILINPVPVAIKPPSIATYKIIKQGEKGVYQIVREDGADIVYINFGAMLKDITRDDLTELYRIVMNRYGVNGPEDELEKLQADCDLKATNIVLQGLPPDVYSLVNHHKVAKDIWDRVKLLMQGTSLSKQERDCKLYDGFDKFSHVKGETLHQHYLRFAQLINDMNIIQMTMQPVQVNTKFLNSLPPEWDKFVTNVKLARDLHTSNYDKLYAYLEQHEAHANEARLMREIFPDLLALVDNYHQLQSHFNNYHSQSSLNPRNQTTIQYGRVTVHQVQGRQGQNLVGSELQGNASGLRGNTSGQVKVIKCYNCQGEGYMARQFIHNAAFQSDDLDAYEFDCDDIFSAKAVLMANLSSYDPNVLSEVVQIVMWYLDSRCSKHMTGNRSQLTNFINNFLGTVKFGNDQIANIMGYDDYQIGNVTLSRVYYVEGLGHNVFFVGQLCDSDLKVALRKHTCFVRNLEGVDLLSGSRGTNLYTLSIGDMIKSSPVCLLSKDSKTNSWLWHRRLCHLNFGTINQLAKQGLVRGLPKLKFEKDHLCSACSLGKSKKHSYKPKSEDTNQEKLYLMQMDLCGPMRVESINGRSIF